MDSLNALDPNRPIREADVALASRHVRSGPISRLMHRSFRVLLDARVLARATGSDSADGDGVPRCSGNLHSALCQGIRYDLQQRLRRDRDLSLKRPVMRGDQQRGCGHAAREQPHRKQRCKPIVAVHERDRQ